MLTLTGGQVNDGVMLKTALEPLNIEGSTVLADKAYGSQENRDYIMDHHFPRNQATYMRRKARRNRWIEETGVF